MTDLRQSTGVTVIVGQAVDQTSGTTAITNLTLAGRDAAGLIKSNSATSVSIGGRNFAHSVDGYYELGLLSTDVNVTGQLDIFISDYSYILGLREKYEILSQPYYDMKHGDGGGVTVLQIGTVPVSDTGGVTVVDKTGFSLSGTSTTLDDMNDLNAVEFWGNATRTLSGTSGSFDDMNDTNASEVWANNNRSIVSGVTIDAIKTGVTLPYDQSSVTVGWVLSGSTTKVNLDKTGYSISGTSTTLDDMNDINGLGLVIESINSGVTVNSIISGVTLPYDQSSVTIGWVYSGSTTGTNLDKTGYSISGTSTTLDALNDINTVAVNAEVDTALADINLNQLIPVSGSVNSAETTATIIHTGLTEATNDHYNNSILLFTSGALLNQARRIFDYDGGVSKTINVSPAFTEAALDGNTFVIVSGNYLQVGINENNDKNGYSISGTSTTLDDMNDTNEIEVWTSATRALTDKAGFTISGTSTTLDDMNDINVSEIWANADRSLVSGVTIDAIKTGVTIPYDQSSVTIGWVFSGSTTKANLDKTGYSISGTSTTLDDMNDINGLDITIASITSGVTINAIISSVTLATGVTVAWLGGERLGDTGGVTIAAPSKTGFFISGTSTTLDDLNDLNAGEITGTGDWTSGEKEQIRDALGIGGTSTVSASAGQLQDIIAGVNVTNIISSVTLESAVTVGLNSDKTGYSISGTSTTLDDLNDINGLGITVASITSGVTVNAIISGVTLESAVTVGTNQDKTGYSISGSSTTLDALNDINIPSIWSNTDRSLASGVTVNAIISGVTLPQDQTGVSIGWVVSGATPGSATEYQEMRYALGISGVSTPTSGDGMLDFLYNMEGGRWKIDEDTSTMLFYKADNVTLIATFNLLDSTAGATVQNVFERTRA